MTNDGVIVHRVFTLNVSTGLMRFYHGSGILTHAHLSFGRRLPTILDRITGFAPDIVLLQDVDRHERPWKNWITGAPATIDSRTPLVDSLTDLGYEVICTPYSPRSQGHCYITAVRRDSYEVLPTAKPQVYLTDDLQYRAPNPLRAHRSVHGFGATYERCVAVTTLRCLNAVNRQHRLLVVNVHLPHEREARMCAMGILRRLAEPHERVIVAGDLSCFPPADSRLAYDVPQMNLAPLVSPDGLDRLAGPATTFVQFPFDVGRDDPWTATVADGRSLYDSAMDLKAATARTDDDGEAAVCAATRRLASDMDELRQQVPHGGMMRLDYFLVKGHVPGVTGGADLIGPSGAISRQAPSTAHASDPLDECVHPSDHLAQGASIAFVDGSATLLQLCD
jgi:hypothetical protein